MLRHESWPSRFLGATALASALTALSCGGGDEPRTVAGPAPFTAVQPTSTGDADGSVGEAAKPTKTLCHYDAVTKRVATMTVADSAILGHLSHGDVEGSCAGACPCFSASDPASTELSCAFGYRLASACGTSEPLEYSLVIGCEAAQQTPLEQLEWWIADVDEKSCYGQVEGQGSTFKEDLALAQVTACKQFIVNSPYYVPRQGSGDTCPR